MKHFHTHVFIFLLAGLFSNANAQSPELAWAGGIEHNIYNIVSEAIATDAAGNSYTTGYFYGTVDFDPGSGVFNLVSARHGYDLFVRKTDASGKFIWARRIGGNGTDGGNAVALDATGNVYLTGFYAKTVDFDPGAGVVELSAAGSNSAFVLKLDNSGNFQWVRNIGSTDFAEGRSIGVDPSGSICVSGQFNETVEFNSGIYSITSSGKYDGFVEKLDPNGTFLWAVNTIGAGSETYGPLSIDPSGSIILTGNFSDTVDFDPGAGIFTLVAAGTNDIFVQKLDGAGQFQWAGAINSTSPVNPSSVGLDSAGNIYLAGWYYGFGSVDFDPGPDTFMLPVTDFKCLFVEKLDKTGHLQWAKGLYVNGSTDCKMVTNAAGNIFLTGYFEKTVDFDPGPAEYFLSSNGAEDIFFEKLDASGAFLWAKSIGGPYDDSGFDIALDTSGNIYSTGNFQWLPNFDPDTLNLFPGNGYGVYLHKMDSDGHIIWANTTKGLTGTTVGVTMALNAAGDMYSAGAYSGTIDFDPGPDTANLSSEIERRLFIRKQDTNGNLLWIIDFGSSPYSLCPTLTTDAEGNIYAAGSFSETADFDPDPNNVSNMTSSGDVDVFIQKMDSSGNLLWVKSIGGTGSDNGQKVIVDAFGNVYVAGTFSATADFDPGPDVFQMSVAPGTYNEYFILKLDASGNFLWAKQLGESMYIADFKELSMAVDSSGNVYRTGGFKGVTDFDPGPGVYYLSSYLGSRDIFIQKLDASGNFLWAKKTGYSNEDEGQSIKLDGSGNVYVAGVFQNSVDFDPGPGTFELTAPSGSSMFIEKLDSGGNFLWAKSLDLAAYSPEPSLALDEAGNIYSTGYFNKTCDMDPGPGVFMVTPVGSYDIFLHKLDSDGNFQWVQTTGGASSSMKGKKIALDASDNIYVEGGLFGTADLDPGPGEIILSSTASGTTIPFFTKWIQVTSGVSENTFSSDIKAYPNPASGAFSIDMGAEYADLQVNVLSITGQLVSQKQYSSAGLMHMEIPGSPGMYFIAITDPKGKYAVLKVVKQ